MERKLTLTITAEELPASVYGVSVPNKDGYTILINGTKPGPEQAAAFLHECLHIWHNDHNDTRTADTIEAERHEELQQILGLLQKI